MGQEMYSVFNGFTLDLGDLYDLHLLPALFSPNYN